MKAPKYIQICIRRMFYWRKVVESNARNVERWMKANNVNKNTPLTEFMKEQLQMIDDIIEMIEQIDFTLYPVLGPVARFSEIKKIVGE